MEQNQVPNRKNTPLNIITARESNRTTLPEVKNKSESLGIIVVSTLENKKSNRTPVMI